MSTNRRNFFKNARRFHASECADEIFRRFAAAGIPFRFQPSGFPRARNWTPLPNTGTFEVADEYRQIALREFVRGAEEV